VAIKQAGVRHAGPSPSLLSTLLGRGRSTQHPGSKRGYVHVSAVDVSALRAQQWAAQTGRPIPPSLRARGIARDIAPRTTHARLLGYRPFPPAPVSTPVPDLLDTPSLTGPERRRLLHKAGHNGERPAGYRPAAFRDPGPRAPRTPAQKRRLARNAAQRRRSEDRL